MHLREQWTQQAPRDVVYNNIRNGDCTFDECIDINADKADRNKEAVIYHAEWNSVDHDANIDASVTKCADNNPIQIDGEVDANEKEAIDVQRGQNKSRSQ